MRIISRGTLRDFWVTHTDTEQALRAWFNEASEAHWPTPKAIKQAYPSADILSDNRIVFNIKGDHYRLIVKIHYNTGIIFIRLIGTHAEYDKIDATTV